jgi:pseudouridine synthase
VVAAAGIAPAAPGRHPAARVVRWPRKSLDRCLSRAGLCSRGAARLAIAQGRVTVNGRSARDPELRVRPDVDRIACDGVPLQPAGREVWMLHKPPGYVTTRADELGRATVYALLPADAPWLGPVGRLDRDTSGLLLFTNDSDLANAITDPATKLAKTYIACCAGVLGDAALQALAGGIALDDGPTRPAQVTVCGRTATGAEGTTTIELVLTEGRNRQVRRMVEAVGSQVLTLHRSRIGPLALGDLPEGAARRLTDDEVAALRRVP